VIEPVAEIREIDGPLVVCSVAASDVDGATQALNAAPAGCALVELRADRLRPDETASLVRGAGRPLIVTIRRKQDGGGFDGSEAERRQALCGALEAGARFVDVEWDGALASLADDQAYRSRVILSQHGVVCREDQLLSLYRRMCDRPGIPLKIVASAASPSQLPALRRLLGQALSESRKLSAFALGRAGALSRLMGPAWGSWATYGALERGAETGRGQYAAKEMLELYDVLRVSSDTRRFALAGTGVGGSPSPAMHAAGYGEAGIDARYFAVEVDTLDELVPLLDPEDGVGFDALAVTMPFKEDAASRCAERDELSRTCGAVNTVVVESGGWRGYNTDGPGALARIRMRLDPAGRRAAVLGAGGTARAMAAALVGAGAGVTFFNRTADRARRAAVLTGADWAPLEDLAGFPWDLLLHATPRGRDGERFFDPGWLRGELVLDAVYGPRPTALVDDARHRGLDVIDGLELLAAQAGPQFRLMTGREAEFELMRAAGMQWISGRPS
jgi:3-dehydroquinate dehydratase/shikimate dehydrogenase